MKTVTLSHYSIEGTRVHQVFVGGMPVTRETTDEDAARASAERILNEILTGSVAGTSPRKAEFSEWDGDAFAGGAV